MPLLAQRGDVIDVQTERNTVVHQPVRSLRG
jgi:hypothetical protein